MIDPNDSGLGGVDWIYLSVDRRRWLAVVGKAINLPVTLCAENLLTGRVTVSLSWILLRGVRYLNE
jgi:hypothetical protein